MPADTCVALLTAAFAVALHPGIVQLPACAVAGKSVTMVMKKNGSAEAAGRREEAEARVRHATHGMWPAAIVADEVGAVGDEVGRAGG